MQQSVSITSRRSLVLTTVGIGSDFDGVPSVPVGLEDVSKMPALTLALMKRGYKETDIQKIMGGNFLRVVKEVVGN
jgi:membrane dipeptidase